MKRILKLTSVFCFVLLTICSAQADFPQLAQKDVEIISSNSSGLVVEINVPDPQIKKSTIDNVTGVSIGVIGYSSTNEPGKPALPVRAITFAVPDGAHPSLQILEIEEKNEPVDDIIPAPTFSTVSQFTAKEKSVLRYEKDELAYRSTQFLPNANVKFGTTSKMRGLSVLSALFHPIRYNPSTRQMKRVTRIRFAIDFNVQQRTSNIASFETSDAFTTLFSKTLVNYEQARGWTSVRQRLLKKSNYFLDEGKEWFKVYTDKTGVYKIKVSDLIDAGFSRENINPQHLRLFNHGEEVAIRLVIGDDGTLDPEDYIEFFVQAFKNEYTTENVYWLTNSDSPGKRMPIIDGTPHPNTPTLSFGQNIIVQEKDFFHIANFPGHGKQAHWFMDSLFAPATKSYEVNLGEIETNATSISTLVFRMQGFAANLNVKPDHHTVVNINGQEIYSKYWDGRISFTDTVKFEHSILNDGVNQIEFNGPADTENTYLDWQLIDFFELHYNRKNTTVTDSLAFYALEDGPFVIQAIGFSNSKIDAYEISTPDNPTYITELYRNTDQVKFEYNTARSRFLILSDEHKNVPIKIEKDDPSEWREPTHRADYIIITFDEFYPDVTALASFHEANGRAVQIVKVQDIYDEFGYGIYGTQAIKEFLLHAYQSWVIKPEFVLFVGDASWNPRRLRPELESYGHGQRTDFLPTHFFEADIENAQATSDSWFTCFDGDDDVLPEMMTGRLPARSRIETQYMVQKIINYATRFEKGAWQNTASFVADIGEGGTNAFEDSSDSYIKKYIPSNFTTNRIYLSNLGMPQTKDEILNAFGEGCLTLNYFGHGAVRLWAKQSIFSNADIPDLDENIQLPFVFTMSCINGYFADPSSSGASLGELLMAAENKGAIAVFTGSGKAFASTLQPLANKLYHTLYSESNPYVGVFTNAGLLNMHATFPGSTDHVQFYILFGDPATRLHYTAAGESKEFAWFSGHIDFKGENPPPQSWLAAFIKDQKYTTGLINSDDGAFGPVYIPKDNPNTREKDGGAPGDSVYFKIILPNDSAQTMKPALPWMLGETANIILYVEGNSVANGMSVDFYVDQDKVGEQFYDGDPISMGETIYVEINNVSHQMTSTDFNLFINNERLSEDQVHASTYNPVTQKMQLIFTPQNLPDGEYELQIRAVENQPFKTEKNSFRFTVSSILALQKVVNFPNPFSETTKFTFMLHNNASVEVSIKIYTVAGRLIHKINSFADVGYNEIGWDGCDSYGDHLANGVYFYKISANDGKEHVEFIERLVVMR